MKHSETETKKETEKEFVDKIENFLSRFMKIQREVETDCKKGRIDIIATDKQGNRYGIECKRNDSKRGEKIGEFILQALRYKDCKFGGVHIPIFMAPPLSYKYFILNEESKHEDGKSWHRDRHLNIHEHHTINGMLGAFGIGELRKGENYVYFSFSNKVIWTSKLKWNTNEEIGTHEENYKKLFENLNDDNSI